MASIKIILNTGDYLYDGKQIIFKAPCNGSQVTNLIIGDEEYQLVDSCNSNVKGCGYSFDQNTFVSVLIDTVSKKAYITNAGQYKLSTDLLSGAFVVKNAEHANDAITLYGGTLIKEGDLNDYITEGNYYIPTNEAVEDVANVPTISAGMLKVLSGTGIKNNADMPYAYMLQIYIAHSCEMYVRHYDKYNGWWCDWKQFAGDSQYTLDTKSNDVLHNINLDNVLSPGVYQIEYLDMFGEDATVTGIPEDTSVIGAARLIVERDSQGKILQTFRYITSDNALIGIYYREFMVDPNTGHWLKPKWKRYVSKDELEKGYITVKKAEQDADGNNLPETYAKKSELLNGNLKPTFAVNAETAGSAALATRATRAQTADTLDFRLNATSEKHFVEAFLDPNDPYSQITLVGNTHLKGNGLYMITLMIKDSGLFGEHTKTFCFPIVISCSDRNIFYHTYHAGIGYSLDYIAHSRYFRLTEYYGPGDKFLYDNQYKREANRYTAWILCCKLADLDEALVPYYEKGD